MANPAQEYASLIDLLSPQDPRKKLALAQAMQGTETGPVGHWTQGAARMANAFLGNYDIGQYELEKKLQAQNQINAGRADPQLGGSGVVPPPLENPSLVSKLASLLGGIGGGGVTQQTVGGQPPMGGVIGQPQQPTGEPQPPPPPMSGPSPLPPPGPPVAAGTRPPVQPSARVWGDKEAEAAGLYEPAPAAAPNNRMVAALGGPQPSAVVPSPSERQIGKLVLSQAMANQPPPLAPGPPLPPDLGAPSPAPVSPPVPAPGTSNAPVVAPRRQPTIPPEEQRYINSLLSNPETFAQGMARRAKYEKLEEDPKLRMIDDMRANPAKHGLKNEAELDAAIKQVGSGITQTTTVNSVADPILKGIGEDVITRSNNALTAKEQTIPAIHEARKQLDSGAITGAFAGGRLGLSKIGNLFGISDPKAVEGTETMRAAIGTTVLAHAKSLGANPSNTDRDYIEKVMGGQIGLNEGSIRKILDIQEKWARDSITNSNSRAQKLIDANPTAYRHLGGALIVDHPPQYQAPQGAPVRVSSPAEAGKLPRGTKIILPDGSPGVVP